MKNHLPSSLTGIDELTVPPIEPLVIPKMQMENGHGAVRVRAILSNMTIHGASNYTVLNVRYIIVTIFFSLQFLTITISK